MSSNWDKKRTRDAHYSNAPNYLRVEEFEKKARDEQQKANETTVTAQFAKLCRPMKVSKEKGTEDAETIPQVNESQLLDVGKTAPGGPDGHAHTVMVDMFGNGETSYESGHYHVVRSGRISSFSNSDTGSTHAHEATLDMSVFPTYYPTAQ